MPNGLIHIGKSAFRGCTSLKTVTLPIGPTHIDKSAFSTYTALSVHLPRSRRVAKLAILLEPTPKFYLPNGELCPVGEVVARISKMKREEHSKLLE
jgi:hypothetical protein